MVFSLFYVFVITPLEVVYNEPSASGWVYVGNSIDLLFWTDIIICFRTTFINNDGELVTDGARIAKNYMLDFFFIDLFCCLPGYPGSLLLTELAGGEGEGSSSAALKLGKAPRVIRAIRSIKMLKMLRVMKVGRMMDEMRDSFPKSIVIVKLLKLLFMTSFFLHINACAFSFVSQGQDAGQSWADEIVFYKWTSEYINALYWATTTCTTVGYGDIAPVSDSEKAFGIASMAIGVGMYGYIIGSMTDVVASTSALNHALQERMDQIYEFVARHNFPPKTKHGVLTYYRHHFSHKRYVQEKAVMSGLPPFLLEQVRNSILKSGLRKVRFMRVLDVKFFSRMMDLLNPRQAEPGEDLIQSDDGPSPLMFILRSGQVSLYKPRYKSKYNEGATSEHQRNLQVHGMIKRLITQHDSDNDGVLVEKELTSLLEKLTQEKTDPDQVEEMFALVDSDGNGTITATEFTAWFIQNKVETRANRVRGKALQEETTVDPMRLFGVWSAFNLGNGRRSPYCFIASEHTEYWTIHVDELIAEYREDDTVLILIDATIVEPARRYGPELDYRPVEEMDFDQIDFCHNIGARKKRIAHMLSTLHGPRAELFEIMRQLQVIDDEDNAEKAEKKFGAKVQGAQTTLDLDVTTHEIIETMNTKVSEKWATPTRKGPPRRSQNQPPPPTPQTQAHDNNVRQQNQKEEISVDVRKVKDGNRTRTQISVDVQNFTVDGSSNQEYDLQELSAKVDENAKLLRMMLQKMDAVTETIKRLEASKSLFGS